MPQQEPRDFLTIRQAILKVAPAIIADETVRPNKTFKQIFREVAEELDDASDPYFSRFANHLRLDEVENVVTVLAKSPETLNHLERNLGPNRQFGRQGLGAAALVLTFEDDNKAIQILRLTSVNEPDFSHVNHILKPERRLSHNDVYLSVIQPVVPLSFLIRKDVITYAEAEIINDMLGAEIYREAGLVYYDIRPQNGCVTRDGQFAVIEPGAVRSEREEKAEIDKFSQVGYFKSMARDMAARLERFQSAAKGTETLNTFCAQPHERETIATSIFDRFYDVRPPVPRTRDWMAPSHTGLNYV